MSPTVEQQILAKLDEVANEQRAMRDALFGSEFAQGRLPQLESRIDGQQAVLGAHAVQLAALEQLRARGEGGWWIAAKIGVIATFIAGMIVGAANWVAVIRKH